MRNVSWACLLACLFTFVIACDSGGSDDGGLDGGELDGEMDGSVDGGGDGDEDRDGDEDLDAGDDGDAGNAGADLDGGSDAGGEFVDIPLQGSITHVQPMTGIVLWNDHESSDTTAIQLEYSYMPFDQVAVDANPAAWDWSGVESLLDDIASHGHQAVLRFYYVYPGDPTTVPAYIKALPDYAESSASSEGSLTDFPDWSHTELQNFTKNFYTEFAGRYDDDPRLAFIQVGFGLWGEYHIYDPGEVLGVNFPSMAFQEAFLEHMESVFSILRWSISIDAADDSNTPFASRPALLDISFGLFDDSFLHENHHEYNADSFAFFGASRYMGSPVGGELSYYTNWDQRHALDLPDGPHGISYETLAAQYKVSYMIGNDQPSYQTMSRIEQAGIASGYAFQVTSFAANAISTRVTVRNSGIAPIYYDAFVTVNGVRASESLAALMPGDSHEYTIGSGGDHPLLTIECDRMVAGQEIEFNSDLP